MNKQISPDQLTFKLIKTSVSELSLLSFTSTPVRKNSFSFHKSQSIQYIKEETNQSLSKLVEQNKIGNSTSACFTPINPSDSAIISYLSSFKEYLIAINEKKDVINLVMESKRFVVPNVDPERKIIIFDIDDTLLCTIGQVDGKEPIVVMRPHYHDVLQKLSVYYDIWVWTAAVKEYGEYVINKYIDPSKTLIKNAFYRDQCIQILDSIYLKDVRIFENVSLSKVAIVENQLISFCMNIDNGFLIDSYNGGEDDELLTVLDFFGIAAKDKDIRTKLVETFRINDSIRCILGA
jgi:NLI interacting factor-like phosphatase